MSKQIVIYILLGLAVMAVVFFAFFYSTPKTTGEGVLLFTRTDCPHCQIVKKYMEDNFIENKIKIINKEVSEAANAEMFVEKIKACNVPEIDWGVPMLWDAGSCYVGDEDIINYFAEKTKN